MLKQAYDILSEIFSNEGFTQDGFSVKGESPCCIEIHLIGDEVHINFVKNSPSVKFSKYVLFFKPNITIQVLGVVFKKDSGVIKLKNFIDFPFKYE